MTDMSALLKRRLGLRETTDVQGTVGRISRSAVLTAENLWLLVCSAILASIGLDTSSAAVIIGAMLISPLMGPILGVGLGMGVTDRALLQRSLRELTIGTLFSITASALYFAASPLATSTPELIARTRPTLLDVGVAFFGGLAGVIAGSRKDLSLALPGVAIATALMPPLCTVGFGLATGNWAFFFGALYLFLLNAIFIALATFVVVRLLHFPHHEEATPEARRKEKRLVAAVAFLATLPSVYFLYDAALRIREQARIASFISQEIEQQGRAVSQWEHRHADSDMLKVYIAGQPFDSLEAAGLQASLARYQLDDLRLALVQSDVSAEDLTRLEGEVQRGILRAVTAAVAVRDSTPLARNREQARLVREVARELSAAFPEVIAISHVPRLDLLAPDSVATEALLLTFRPSVTRASRRDLLQRAQALARTRLGSALLTVEER
jgi:uncharacterized hydrophobic protein (TIGR00271 family)